MKIALFYLADARYGGWVTFTAHLALALRSAGHEVDLYKVRDRAEPKSRAFGLGLTYRNVTLLDARLLASGPAIVTAVAPNYAAHACALVQDGALLVVHDPTELKAASMRQALQRCTRPPVVIRPANLTHVPEAVFVPHPYVRAPQSPATQQHAVAYSRIDWDKHTHIIAAANAKLPARKRVEIWGAENRMYSFQKLDKVFPEWRAHYHGTFPAELHASVRLARGAKYVVDLSAIAGDGDGTQYTFLEAWDAGATLVVNRKWIVNGTGAVRDGQTAYAVDDEADLVRRLKAEPDPAVAQRGQAELARHLPEAIAPRYVELLQ